VQAEGQVEAGGAGEVRGLDRRSGEQAVDGAEAAQSAERELIAEVRAERRGGEHRVARPAVGQVEVRDAAEQPGEHGAVAEDRAAQAPRVHLGAEVQAARVGE